jgi:hypothetical protein
VANSPAYGVSLVDELRAIVKDTAWIYGQFDFEITAGTVALVEVTDTLFKTTTTGGPAALNLDLDHAAYATIELLVNYLNTQANTRATLLEDADPHHTSTDLRVMVPTVCLNTKAILYTRRYSDTELEGCLNRALLRHNFSIPIDPTAPWTGNYTLATVPPAHYQFILLLGQIEVLKMQVMDGVKRRGTDLTADTFNALRTALEEEYQRTLDRYLAKQDHISVADTEDLGSGVIVQGTLTRNSSRYVPAGQWEPGFRVVPSAQAQAPAVCALSAVALGSGLVKLLWVRSRDLHFRRYELWRHTADTVSNISNYVRPAGAIAALGERLHQEEDQQVTIWVDGATTALTPGDYFYRLYVYTDNEDFAEGDVVPCTVT